MSRKNAETLYYFYLSTLIDYQNSIYRLKYVLTRKCHLAGVKGSSVRMSMYVRVTECTVLVYMHST